MRQPKVIYLQIFLLLAFSAISLSHAQNDNPQGDKTNKQSTQFLLRGIDLFERGQYDSTIFYLRKSADAFRPDASVSRDEFRANVAPLMAHSFKALGVRDSAVLYALRVIELAVHRNDSATAANYLFTVGSIYGEHNAPAQSKQYYIRAGDLAAKIRDNLFASSCYGAASVASGKDRSALELMDRAIKYATLSGDPQTLGDRWIMASGVYYDNGLHEKAAVGYRNAMKYYHQSGDSAGYNMAQSGLMFLFNKSSAQDSAWRYISTPEAAATESLALPNSMQGLKLDLLTANVTSEQRATKLEVLSKQYWQQRAASLRRQIWLISISGALLLAFLLMLYNRQRLRAKAKTKYIEGLESERARISKELHDGVCNDLLALEMELKPTAPEGQMDFLRGVRRDVRILSHELLPPAFQYAAIDEILLDYTSAMNASQGIAVRYNCCNTEKWDDIPQTLALHIYRVVQEAVSNSLRHAAASEITVNLTRGNKQIEVAVSDNGTGFDTLNRSTAGVGLRTIADRVHSVGGKLNLQSTNSGTTVKASFNI